MIAVAYEKPFDTSEQLLENDMTVVLVAGSTLIELLRTSPRQSHRDLYKTASFYDYQVESLPWQFLDPVEENGKSCLIASPPS